MIYEVNGPVIGNSGAAPVLEPGSPGMLLSDLLMMSEKINVELAEAKSYNH